MNLDPVTLSEMIDSQPAAPTLPVPQPDLDAGPFESIVGSGYFWPGPAVVSLS